MINGSNQIDLAAAKGLYAALLGCRIKVVGSAHIAVVGHSNRGHSKFLNASHELIYAAAAVQEAVVCMQMQVYEIHRV